MYAAEAKWRALETDREHYKRQHANSSIEQMGRACYYVPDSKRGRLECQAALRKRILGYDWLEGRSDDWPTGGSESEDEWDDELDDPRAWAD